MKSGGMHGANGKKRGKVGRFRREWIIALFCLLMATALPALVAIVAGVSEESVDFQLSDETVFGVCRHNGAEREEVTLGRLIALSLAATNSSDTPEASLQAQAILLRSRGVWWMNYCTIGEEDSYEEEEKYNSTNESAQERGISEEPEEQNGELMKESVRTQKANDSLPILCDSSVHGLPYLSYDELVDRWGEKETAARISAADRAIQATRGQVLCYDGEVVPALLHHSSGSITRSVESLPWLSAVSTPEEERETVCARSEEEVRHCLAAALRLLLPSDSALWELSLETDSQGRVESVTILGQSFSGSTVANALNLPSVAFEIEMEGETLTFICRGEGSGCGLSREGAAIYAADGLSCGEILLHYYPSCTVGKIG